MAHEVLLAVFTTTVTSTVVRRKTSKHFGEIEKLSILAMCYY
jgi:hypothetical protein